jgi:hypothetical protein
MRTNAPRFGKCVARRPAVSYVVAIDWPGLQGGIVRIPIRAPKHRHQLCTAIQLRRSVCRFCLHCEIRVGRVQKGLKIVPNAG